MTSSLRLLPACLAALIVAFQAPVPPALPRCSLPATDTTAWKQVVSTIAPVTLKVPGDFTRATSASRSETWSGKSPPFVFALTPVRPPPIRGVRQLELRQSQLAHSCVDSIGALRVAIQVDSVLVPTQAGDDSLPYYRTTARFALRGKAVAWITGAPSQSLADQQTLIRIILSLRPRQRGK